MSISLSRRVTTSPIDNPSKGQSNYTWGSIQIARPQPNLSSDQGGVPQAVEAQGGRWLWEGRVPVPKDEKTLESRGVSIRVSMRVSASDLFIDACPDHLIVTSVLHWVSNYFARFPEVCLRRQHGSLLAFERGGRPKVGCV